MLTSSRGMKIDNHNTHVSWGLILGAPPFRKDRTKNPFLFNRLKTGVELFKSGNVEGLIISGYDYETAVMRQFLADEGIAKQHIIIDSEGSETPHSLKYCKNHNYSRIFIVSQFLHANRACILARHLGLKATPYYAKTVIDKKFPIFLVRENLAGVKAMCNVIFD